MLIAFLMGVITGLRSLTPAAAVSWAAYLMWISLAGTGLSFLSHAATAYILGLLAIGELINDKLPKTPSRKAPGPFAGRVVFGALVGAAMMMAAQQSWIIGAIAGAIGAVVGTLGGYQARVSLVKALKSPDWVVALCEDVIAVGGAFFLVTR